jgi:hypothetical protein
MNPGKMLGFFVNNFLKTLDNSYIYIIPNEKVLGVK